MKEASLGQQANRLVRSLVNAHLGQERVQASWAKTDRQARSLAMRDNLVRIALREREAQGMEEQTRDNLLAWSDNLKELKAICHCGSKATMVLRLDGEGNPVTEGSQVEIGGNDRYISMCRKHFKEGFFGK